MCVLAGRRPGTAHGGEQVHEAAPWMSGPTDDSRNKKCCCCLAETNDEKKEKSTADSECRCSDW